MTNRIFPILYIIFCSLSLANDYNIENRIVPVYCLDALENKPAGDLETGHPVLVISLSISSLADNKQIQDLIRDFNHNYIILDLVVDDIDHTVDSFEAVQRSMIELSFLSGLSGMILRFNAGNARETAFITKTLSSILKNEDNQRKTGIMLRDTDSKFIHALRDNEIGFYTDYLVLDIQDSSMLENLKRAMPSKPVYYMSQVREYNSIIHDHAHMLSLGFSGGFLNMESPGHASDLFSVADMVFEPEMYAESGEPGLILNKHNENVPCFIFFNPGSYIQTIIFRGKYTPDDIGYEGLSLMSMELDDPDAYSIGDRSAGGFEPSYRLFRSGNFSRFLNIIEGDDLIIVRYIPYSLKNAGLVSEKVDIREDRILTAEDILSRFFPKKVVSDTMLENYTAFGTTHYFFSAPGLEDRIEIKTRDQYFFRKGFPIEWKELSIYFNGSEWSRDKFPEIPFIGSGQLDLQPSDINFDEVYEYTLAGEKTVNSRRCYEIRFLPKKDDLPDGSLFIDSKNFHLVRLEYFQKGLKPPLVSAHQVEDYSYLRIDDITYVIPEKIRSNEILNMVGRNIIIDKSRQYDEIFINSRDFEKERKIAHESGQTMMQLTKDGPRILKRDSTGNRILQEEIKKNFLFLVGGLVGDLESKYVLLPLAGINYFDYDFLKKGYHFNLFTAGAVNTLSLSTGKPVLNKYFSSLSFDIFLPLLYFTDQIYEEGTNLEEMDIDVYASSANLGLTRRLSRHLNLYLSTQLRYEDYKESDHTLPEFVIPGKSLVMSQSADIQLSYFGFSGSLGVKYSYRNNGSNFGIPADIEDNLYWGRMQRNWYSCSIKLKKDFEIRGIDTQVSLSYRKLEDYDRFNLMDLGGFSGGIHGFTPGRIKTDEVYALNLVSGFDIASALKWKLYFDASWAHDIYSADKSLFYGAGFSFSLILWKSYVCNIDYGYGFNHPNEDGTEGNHRFTFVFLKFLR